MKHTSKRLIVFSGLLAACISVQGTVLDLTTGGASGFVGTAFFEQVNPQSTGTGILDPFLRLQANGTEHGYNTSAGPQPPFDAKGGVFTHDLLFGDLTRVIKDGTEYFEFLLDLNEINNDREKYISLESVQIWTGSTAAPSTESLATIGTIRYDMDNLFLGGASSSRIDLDASLNHGSGGGDMFAYIPTSLFAGVAATDNVYFYSAFSESDAGFEEWALIERLNPVPEPTTLAGGILLGALAAGHMVRRSRK
ncbi:MAG: hypothetical protein SFY81_10510 [Verrucomicrobiota bacterium]|nr:hypothetical protein [Verrucomicrobiota bacterium]